MKIARPADESTQFSTLIDSDASTHFDDPAARNADHSPTQLLLTEAAAKLRDHPRAVMDNQPLFFLDGTFEELANELAGYIDNVRKGDDKTTVAAEIAPLIEAQKKDDALKVLVTASSALNAAPEKEFSAAYNLLLYLVNQSPSVNMFLRKVCENLSRPITSSPAHGPGLALFELSVLFNMLKPENEVRFNVFQSILRVAQNSGMYESVKPQLSSLDTWIQQWDLDEEEQRKLFNLVAEIADDAGEEA